MSDFKAPVVFARPTRPKDWVVLEIERTNDVYYPWRVSGLNYSVIGGRCCSGRLDANGEIVKVTEPEKFSWRVPSIDDPRYDLSRVTVPR